MGSLVAWVGIPTNTPSQPKRAAITSAAASAALVFPSPIAASTATIPGSGMRWTVSTSIFWNGREGLPKRESTRSSTSGTSRAPQPLLSRSSSKALCAR